MGWATLFSKALLVVAGVREEDGNRELLSVRITDCENEACWSAVFDDLNGPGVHRVKLIVSDGHPGIQVTASTAFLGAAWQMCQVHTTRAVLKNIPEKEQATVVDPLREAFGNEQRRRAVADDPNAPGQRTPANAVERFLPGLLSATAFPLHIRNGSE